MERNSSWETDSRSANEEISFILRKLKVYYRVHKSQLLDPIMTLNFSFYARSTSLTFYLP
jgi:hypothetical protein